MNFQIISDLHGRFNRIEVSDKADILLFAGDSSENIDITFKMLKSFSIPVLFIPGNHEFYHKDYKETYDKIQEFCDKSNGDIIFLDNKVVEIDDYQIVGSTLWSDFLNLDPFLIESSWGMINDYRYIKTLTKDHDLENEIYRLNDAHSEKIKKIMSSNDDISKAILTQSLNKRTDFFNKDESFENINLELFTPFHSYILNKKNKEWLNNALSESFNGKRIVMTHHSPSYTPLAIGGYTASPFEIDDGILKRKYMPHKIGAYCNSMEDVLLNSHVDTWIHGHFHEFLNYRMGSANVICNATGNRKNQDMSFRKYLFNCSDKEKQEGLKNQLFLFKKTLSELFIFLNNIIPNDRQDKYSNILFLNGYWKEIEIILNSIQSLPYTEIPSSFSNYYPNPFLDLNDENLNYEVLTDSLFRKTIKEMLIIIRFLYEEIKDWLLKLN